MEEHLLTRLGFKKEWRYECILSTRDTYGRPHATAVGVCSPNLTTLRLRLYHGSQALENLRREETAAINLVDDVEIIASVVLGQDVDFGRHADNQISFLSDAECVLMVTVQDLKPSEAFDEVTFSIDDVIRHQTPRLINRGELMLLEALIDHTRKGVIGETEIHERMKRYSEIIEKTAPDSEYARIMRRLLA